MEKSSSQVSWIKNLPDEGGAWGIGITETVSGIESELHQLEASVAVAVEQIRSRKKLLAQTVRRAAKEAPLLYSDKELTDALGAPSPE